MSFGTGKRAAGIVCVAVIGSRVLGLVREQIFAAMFGAGRLLDSFLAAFQIPNLMRDLFAEGALSTAFTTVFAKTFEKDGEQPAWRLAGLLVSTVAVVLGAVCIFGIVFSPAIVHVTNYGFYQVPGKFELTVQLTRILFPFILFVSLAAVVMGMLNARFIFGVPASASSIFNLVSIVSGVLFAFLFDPQTDWRHPHFTEKALFGVSLGVLLGGLAQLAVQLPALRAAGFRLRWELSFRDPGLRRVWVLMWPSVIAGAAVQVNVLVNGMLASEIDGARSWLNCAFRLMQFPIGVFGVAIATVTLPMIARHHARDDLAAFGKQVEDSLRLVLYLTIPAAVGLFALAPQIVGVIYEHGQFVARDTAQTAAALRAYSVGLAGYAAIKVLLPCFYALNLPKLPLRVSLLAIGLNLGLNLVLVKLFHMGHVGLAMTTGALAIVNFVQLLVYLRSEVNYGSARRWVSLGVCVSLAALLCGMGAAKAADLAEGSCHGFTGRCITLAIGMVAGIGIYGLATLALRVPETAEAWKLVQRTLLRITTAQRSGR